jgi:hypothetical protein
LYRIFNFEPTRPKDRSRNRQNDAALQQLYTFGIKQNGTSTFVMFIVLKNVVVRVRPKAAIAGGTLKVTGAGDSQKRMRSRKKLFGAVKNYAEPNKCF